MTASSLIHEQQWKFIIIFHMVLTEDLSDILSFRRDHPLLYPAQAPFFPDPALSLFYKICYDQRRFHTFYIIRYFNLVLPSSSHRITNMQRFYHDKIYSSPQICTYLSHLFHNIFQIFSRCSACSTPSRPLNSFSLSCSRSLPSNQCNPLWDKTEIILRRL